MTSNHDDRAQAKAIRFSEHTFAVELSGGQQIEFSYAVSPRLLLATQSERESGALMPGGFGIEWDLLNEHLSVDGLVQGKVSTETWRSVYDWYELRQDNPDLASPENTQVVISQ